MEHVTMQRVKKMKNGKMEMGNGRMENGTLQKMKK